MANTRQVLNRVGGGTYAILAMTISPMDVAYPLSATSELTLPTLAQFETMYSWR
mgnify:CR=1 FL=1